MPAILIPVLALLASGETPLAPREAIASSSEIAVVREPGRSRVIDAEVPEDFAYVDGSATPAERVMVSVDGGRRFAPLTHLVVVEQDGPRPARAEDVTTLRWELPPAAPRVRVGYRVAPR